MREMSDHEFERRLETGSRTHIPNSATAEHFIACTSFPEPTRFRSAMFRFRCSGELPGFERLERFLLLKFTRFYKKMTTDAVIDKRIPDK